MAMKLSNLTFIDEDDIVAASGIKQILNVELVNNFVGEDRITGTGNDYSFNNASVLDIDDGNIDDGNDTITGIEDLQPNFGSSYDIVNSGILNTEEDNDILTGISRDDAMVNSGNLNADEDNDILTGSASRRDFYGARKLKIHSITCLFADKDPVGPDDTYIEINGNRVWGDYNMQSGRQRAVNYSVDIPQYSSVPWVELFDDDNHWSSNDSIGGFTPKDTGGRETMEKVGYGGSYLVYYSLGVPDPWHYSTRDYTSGVTREESRNGGIIGRRNWSTP